MTTTITRTKPLTIRGVKQILTRAGVDYSQLDFTHRVHENVEVGWSGTFITIESVEVRGPGEARKAARAVLYGESELAWRPDLDVDIYSR